MDSGLARYVGVRACSGLARYMGDWASDATWVKDLHSSLVPLVKDARYVGC